MTSTHNHHHHHHHATDDNDWAAMAEKLEAEGEMFSPVLDEAIARLHGLLGDGSVSRILDLGCGPGVSSSALARAFPSAHVVAIDTSAELLERARSRAEREGVGSRVQTRCIDIEDGLGDLGPVDVIWVSMVLHHISDLDRTLRRLVDVIRPGGMLAISEFGAPLTAVPPADDAVRSGLWGRWQSASRQALEEHLPHGIIGDWPERLRRAGFEVEAERDCVIDLPAPITAAQRQWLRHQFGQTPQRVTERLDAADLAAVEELSDPNSPRSLAERQDIFIRTGRTLYLAHRPA